MLSALSTSVCGIYIAGPLQWKYKLGIVYRKYAIAITANVSREEDMRVCCRQRNTAVCLETDIELQKIHYYKYKYVKQ